MGLGSSDHLTCLSSQSAGRGDDSEVGAVAGQVTTPTLEGQNSVSWGLGWVLTPFVLCGSLSPSLA